jgi:hypothetical protein
VVALGVVGGMVGGLAQVGNSMMWATR